MSKADATAIAIRISTIGREAYTKRRFFGVHANAAGKAAAFR